MKLPVAAITMAFNESVFLPIWLHYYGSRLGHENLFVIDDGSDDICRNRITNLISRKRGQLDETERARTISYFHEQLLQYYDVVLYSDVDEIIVPDPNLEISLKDYLISCDKDWINPVGLNVLHDRTRERPLDLTQPLFSQRAYVQFEELYCKPMIARVPMRWTPGFHLSARPPCYASDLFLFHLRAMDYDIARTRIKTLNRVSFSEDSLRRSFGFQFRLPEQEYLGLFFSTSEAQFETARSVFDFSDELEKIDGNPVMGSGPVAQVPGRFRNTVELNTANAGIEKATPTTGLDANRLYSMAVSRVMAQDPAHAE
jgi:hypothetical protein